MIAIAFTFPAGRYHATPWDQHVNEGGVEWPPSPWRLMRALVAASYKLVPEVSALEVQRVLAPLRSPPEYSVPPIGEGHSRHYMPAPVTTTKVLDAFVAPGEGELVAIWPEAALGPAELAQLDRILAQLTYLGRSESWVDARRVECPVDSANCWPCEAEQSNVTLTALESDAAYQGWRSGFLEGQSGLGKKERREPPGDWWEVLHQDTGRLRREGWSRPPGMRRVPYRHDPRAAARRPHLRRGSEVPALVRFELQAKVLPRLEDALLVGDRFRTALLKISDGHPTFLGRDEAGVRQGHRHAFFLPTDEDRDGRIDHLSVFAPEGLDATALGALNALERVWGAGAYDLFPMMTATIATSELAQYGGTLAQGRGRVPTIGPARVWESHTPFVAPRHTKRRAGTLIETNEEQAARLVVSLGLPEPTAVAPLSADATPSRIAWHKFRNRRLHGGGSGAGNASVGLRLTFAAPVVGPIAIGYGAHQGLGQFFAMR